MFQAESNGSIFKHLQNHLHGAGRLVHQGHRGAHNVGGGVVEWFILYVIHVLSLILKSNEAFSKPYLIIFMEQVYSFNGDTGYG